MNRLTKNALKWAVGILVILALGIAGSIDRNEAVLSSISQELYQKVLLDLGGSASSKEIVERYESKKAMYDSLGI